MRSTLQSGRTGASPRAGTCHQCDPVEITDPVSLDFLICRLGFNGAGFHDDCHDYSQYRIHNALSTRPSRGRCKRSVLFSFYSISSYLKLEMSINLIY